MTELEVYNDLVACGAIQRDSHFALTPKEVPPGSGKYEYLHSDGYVSKERAFEDVLPYFKLAREIAMRFLKSSLPRVDFVVGPEKGGIALCFLVALVLNSQGPHHVQSVYAEKKPGGGFELRRGFRKGVAGKSGLVVEDVIVSGTSFRGVMNAVIESGGTPAAGYAICSHGRTSIIQELPFESLCEVTGIRVWPESQCQLCLEKGPESVRIDLGHGREFLIRKGIAIPKEAAG